MKKNLALIVLTCATLFACQKQKEAITGAPITLAKDPRYTGRTIMPPMQRVESSRTLLTVGNQQNTYVSQITVSFDSSTIPLSAIKNFQMEIKDSMTGQTVVSSDIFPTVSNGMDLNLVSTALPQNRIFIIKTYNDIRQGVIGKLRVTTAVTCFWGNGNSNVFVVVGQTTTCGYPSMPKITSTSSSSLITNGQYVVLYPVSLTASGGQFATKGMAWRLLFANNSHADTIRIDSLGLYRNGQAVSVLFSDSLGNPVQTLSELNPLHRKIYATYVIGVGEMITEANTTDAYELKGRVRGLGSSASVGDAISVLFALDDQPPPSGYSSLNKGDLGLNPKLFSSSAQNSGAIPYNFVWSYMTAPIHSAFYGASSSDWTNGYGLTINVQSNILHSRRR